MTETVSSLVIEDLVVRHEKLAAVDHLSLELTDREVTALVGPSGCGKTTLLRAIAGFVRPESGRIVIAGEDVVRPGFVMPPEKRRVGMVFQEGALFPHLTVEQNIAFGLDRLPKEERREQLRKALINSRLEALRGRFPDQLSGGQQQLVALARALAPRPEWVLLDEPFASLDAQLRDRVRDQTLALLSEFDTPALLVTHDQEEALSSAQRVAVMFRGQLAQFARPAEVYRSPATAEVAAFVGGGQLLPCRVRSGRVECSLGSLTTEAPEGAAQLLVRPEALTLADSQRAGVAGRVSLCRYYGHDLIAEIRLDDAEHSTLQVRVQGDRQPNPGSRVSLDWLEASYQLFASDNRSWAAQPVRM